jgi:hypothetical protein
MNQLETPVVFIIFNRPDKTAVVFEEIRKARPKKLFIVADGPRTEAERPLTEKTRAIAEQVDWPCEVHKIYSEKNRGCRWNPPLGITEVFKEVERAIIIEDDCVIDQSAFPYFTELLEQYKDDTRVMSIRASNFQHDNPRYNCPESYYFSRITSPWGWASWRRAWQNYDINMTEWPEIKRSKVLSDVFSDAAVVDRMEYVFDQYYAGTITSWDGIWTLAHFVNNGLSIVPKQNLVTNIGFDAAGTHAKHANNPGANLPRYPLEFPLSHPKFVLPDASNEAYTFRYELDINRRTKQRLIWFAKSQFPRLYMVIKRLKDKVRGR